MNTNPELSTTWSASHKQNPDQVSFLDLPRELRDLIYAHTFHVSGAIFIYTLYSHQSERGLRSKIVRYKNRGATEPQSVFKTISTGLLQTCHQMHAEASPVLYGENYLRVWFLNEMSRVMAYRMLVRHVVMTTESAHLIFGSQDLDAVSHGWKHRFWPRIVDSGEKIIAQFPNVETLCVPMKSPSGACGWRPAFFKLGGKTAERRIELAAAWMRERSSLANERLRDCLHLELEPPPGSISREEYAGSRFAPDEEEWDYPEFESAFERMKALI